MQRNNFGSSVSPQIVKDVVKMARDVEFPLDKLPKRCLEWIKAMSLSRNARPEFVLLSSLTVINTILGPQTKLELREGSQKENVLHPRMGYAESPGLYVTILCEPGSGKSNAYDIAIQEPLQSQEDESLKTIVIQDYTKKGLFEALDSHDGRGVLASSELQNFYDNLMRKHLDGYGERTMFNNLYDGTGHWVMTSSGRKADGGKSKREELSANSFSIVGFSQPEPFISEYRPMARVRDGFVDRLLVCTIKPKLLFEHEIDYWVNELDKFSLQSFHTVYKHVYEYHLNQKRRYKLDDIAKGLYISYSDNIVNEINKCWEEGEISTKNYSKDKRNLARIALGLHVLTSVVGKFLTNESEESMSLNEGDISLNISSSTFKLAEDITDYFRQQREILNMVFDQKSKQAVNGKNRSKMAANENNDLTIEIVTNFLLEIHSKGNYSDYLLRHSDGIVLKLNDVPDCKISEVEIKTLMESKGVKLSTNKAYYFKSGRKRALMLPWEVFSDVDQQKLKIIPTNTNKAEENAAKSDDEIHMEIEKDQSTIQNSSKEKEKNGSESNIKEENNKGEGKRRIEKKKKESEKNTQSNKDIKEDKDESKSSKATEVTGRRNDRSQSIEEKEWNQKIETDEEENLNENESKQGRISMTFDEELAGKEEPQRKKKRNELIDGLSQNYEITGPRNKVWKSN